MSVVAVLSVLFDAKTSDLEKGFDRAAKKAGDFKDAVTIGDVQDFAAQLASIAGVALTVDAAFDKLTASFQSLDALSKTSQKLGIASQELAGLQHAAGLSGVDVGALEGGLAKMATTAFKASEGSEKAAEAFAAIGLNGRDIAKLSLEKQFFAVAQALSGVTDNTKKLAVAQAIFGDSGRDLLPLLNQGVDAIKEQVAEAGKLGVAFNSVELQQIEAANDEFSKMSTAIDGLVGQLAVKLAPVAASVFESITGSVANANLSLEAQAAMLDQQTSGWNSLTLAAANVADAFQFVGEIMRLLTIIGAGLFATLLQGFNELVKVASDASKKISGDNLGLDFVAEAIDKGIGNLKKNIDEQAALSEKFFQGGFGATHFEKAQRSLQEQAEKLRAAAQGAVTPKVDIGGTVASGDIASAAPPAALTFGSREAFSAINAAGGDAGTMVDQQKLTVKGIQTQTEILLEQRKELDRIGRWLDGFGGKQVKL